MKKALAKVFVSFCIALLIISGLGGMASAFGQSENSEDKIVQVRIAGSEDVSALNELNVDVLERYEKYGLIEADENTIEELNAMGFRVNELPARTEISVKGHYFDVQEGEPDLDSEMTKTGYRSGTEGLYVVHMIGPVHPEWRNTLEEKGVEIINSIPNYAYEVSMTPEEAEEVESLDFVDWTGIYHPAYKLHQRLEDYPVEINIESEFYQKALKNIPPTGKLLDSERLDDGSYKLTLDVPVDVKLKPDFEKESLKQIHADRRVIATEKLKEGGRRLTVNVESERDLKDLTKMNDVYYISPHLEPQLHGEMDSQMIGGGAWFMDDYSEPVDGPWREGNPNEAYRKYQDYGAYINQIGYTGEDVTITIADTGMGDGTKGDAGHPDLKGRVVGGYGFGTSDYWADGHGHGTHTTGSAAANARNGTGETFNWTEYRGKSYEHADYYKAQGLAYDSELFATKIFSDGGSFEASAYYPIVEEPAQQSHAYVHSNSWGSSSRGAYEDVDEIYDQAVRDADRDTPENRPMVITVSAGNNGARGDGTTGSPGNAKNVITVAASQTYNPPDDYTDAENLAGFSSRGWTVDNRIKPDVTAPGEGIYSLTPWGDYQTMSGTSMSNPAVAGAAGVVDEWYKENYGERPSPALVKSILINTARDLYNNPEAGDTRGHAPNQDQGWGMVDISRLEYPEEDPVPFSFENQDKVLQTGEEQKYVLAPSDLSKPLNITLTWTDKNAESGDSEGGTPVLKNNLDMEVIGPDGKTFRGNAFNHSGGSTSSSSYTYPGESTMSVFDNNSDGWDNVNNVENVFINEENLTEGAYTVRVIGRDIPEDALNSGQPSQDFALTAHNTRRPSDGVIFMENKRYATEDTVNLTAVDWDLQGIDSYGEVGIYSDTDPNGFNVTLDGQQESQKLTKEVDISSNPVGGDVLQVSHDDYIYAEYWDEDIGDGTGKTKTYRAYVDGMNPEPAERLEVDWWSPHGVKRWEDDASDPSGYSPGTSHPANASQWDIRSHGAVNGTTSWDWGDGEFNKLEDEGMESWLISPGIDVPAEHSRQMGLEFRFDHWRDFGDPLLYDGGNLKMSTQGPNGPFKLVKPESGYDGDIWHTHDNPLGGQPGWGGEAGWEQVTVDLSNYSGETVHFKWAAGTEGWHDEDGDHLQGEGWRVDDLALVEILKGKDHNKLYWGASPNDWDAPWDDPSGHLEQYNIYRADSKSGPWDPSNLLDTVRADRSDRYTYVDYGVGEPDGNRWWYVVRGEKDVGNEEKNEIAVAEPGGPSLDVVSPNEGEIFTTDEVTVEWTGDPQINNYEVRLDQNAPIDVGSSTQHTFSNLAEGTHKVGVTGYTGTEAAYEDVEFQVDITPPDLMIYSPVDGGYVNETDFMIDWQGSDDISGIDHYEVRVDGGSWQNVGKSSSYQLTGAAHNDHYTVEIRAFDRAGFTTKATTNFTVDLIDPAIELTFPPDGGWAAKNMTTEWQSNDRVSGINAHMIRIPEDPRYQHWINVGTDTEYSFNDLEGGEEYTVEVVATDRAGNNNLTEARFRVDPEHPQLDIIYPEEKNASDEYHIIGKSDVEVVWSRMDQYSGLSHIDVKLDDQPWKEDIGVPSSYTFTDLENGVHNVTVKVTDNARLTSWDNISFMVDTSPPDLEITGPEQNTNFVEDQVTVTWDGSDDFSGINYYEIRINQGDWINNGVSTEYTFEGLEAQDHFVEVRAKNNAGYSVTKSVTFTVDTTMPTVNILSPEDGELFGTDEVTVKWEGRDNVSDIDYYEVRIDQGSWINVGSSPLYTFKNLEDGERNVEIRAYDVAGNSETVETNFVVDTTAPELELILPEDDGIETTDNIYSRSNLTVTWNSSDETSGITTYEVQLDYDEWVEVQDTEYTFNETELNDGQHILRLRATDEAGYTNMKEATFTVDTASPDLSITNPEEGKIYDESNIMVRWDASDETTEIARYEVSVGGNDWVDTSRDTGYEFTIDDGRPTVMVRAIDNAGNMQESTRDFIVDTTAPAIQIGSPDADEELDAGLFSSSKSVNIDWDGEDNTTEVVDYQVRVDGGPWIDVGTDTEHKFEDLSDGEHTVEIRAEDDAGNVKTREVNFKVSEGFFAAYGWLILLIAAIIVVAIAVFLRRRESEEEEDESEEGPGAMEFDEEGWEEQPEKEPGMYGGPAQEDELGPGEGEQSTVPHPADEGQTVDEGQPVDETSPAEESQETDEEMPPPPPPEESGQTQEEEDDWDELYEE
ncbi:MAG: S8 family serine peptidase [Candidatus Thermoplasmatota archaeon]|nr:S8 family serine peptidase [Candidatus Thermoplasmatota archaeon]